MMRISRKIILILSIGIIILGLQWFINKNNDKPNDLEFEVIVDKMDDTDVEASLFYENFFDKAIKGYRTYLWKNKTINKSRDRLDKNTWGKNSVYPQSSLKKLEEQIKLSKMSDTLDKPIIYYGNTSDYELFIFKDFHMGEWILYFLYDDSVKPLTIKYDSIDDISGCQFDDDIVYIYSNIIYKINVADLSINKLEIPKEKPFYTEKEFIEKERSIDRDLAFIQNDNIYMTFFHSSKVYFYKYNLITGDSKMSSNDDKQIQQIEKLFQYNDGFLTLCTEVETFKPILKYYDNDFNLVDTKYININSKHNNVSAYGEGRYFFLHDNKLYGSMSVDGRHIFEIVVIDADSAELLYQAEHRHKKGRIIMTDMRFLIPQNGKLVYMN